MLKKLLILILLSIPVKLLAQNDYLTGNIFDNNNRTIALQGATVKNLNSKSFALSDKDGHFSIKAKVGDLVTFAVVGYETDTMYVDNLIAKNIFLIVQVNNLKEVDINSVKISPYLNAKDANAKPSRPVDYSKERGGLRLNLGYGKFRREREKVQMLEEKERYEEEITKNFNEETIRKAVKFEGIDIKDFMDMYRPTIEQIKSQIPFNYEYYIVKSYRVWVTLPPNQRKLQPLVKPKN